MAFFNCIKDKPRPIVIPVKPAPTPLKSNIFLAIIVGHNERGQGATNYLGESEFVFNSRIAHKLQVKLADMGIKSAIIFRPKSGGYSHEVRHVRKRVEELECNLALSLHFNAAQRSARGCEVLVKNRSAAIPFADSITDRLNEVLGIKERHDDGVKELDKSHRGSGMMYAIESIGVNAALVEPCFGGYKTEESMAIFENEDRYVSILAEATKEQAN